MIYLGRVLGGEFAVHAGRYRTGNLALVLYHEGAPYAKMSVNVLSELLAPDEFVLNAALGQTELAVLILSGEREPELARLALGLCEDTGRRVAYGYRTGQPVWRLFNFEHRNKQWGV